MKSVREFRGENWKKYNERCDQRWIYAAQQIEGMLRNDEQWGQFKQQLESRKNPFVDRVDRVRERLLSGELTEQQHKDQLSSLQLAYTSSMVFICDDLCEYNLKPRKGVRKYTTPRRFHCDWTVSLRDGIDKIVEQHTDSTNPPKWLNVEKKLCPYYYVDLTKP